MNKRADVTNKAPAQCFISPHSEEPRCYYENFPRRKKMQLQHITERQFIITGPRSCSSTSLSDEKIQYYPDSVSCAILNHTLLQHPY